MVGLLVAALNIVGVSAQQAPVPIAEDFHEETVGADPQSFSPEVGFWSISADGGQPVLLEDGSRWEGSDIAKGLAAQAQALYGSRWAEFIDDLEIASYWPVAVFNKTESLVGGTLSARFKVLGGEGDQDCGIAFAIQPNCDFLAVKSDTLENDIVLYQAVQGQVNTLMRIDDVPTSGGDWHEQKLVLSGKHLSAYLDDQLWLSTDLDIPRLAVSACSQSGTQWSPSPTSALIRPGRPCLERARRWSSVYDRWSSWRNLFSNRCCG